jgi:ribosomal protein S18 acetylase RimI-like enzyme
MTENVTDEETWTSARYSSADAEAVLELMRRLSPESEANEGSMDWQLERGPAGPAIGLVARETASSRPIAVTAMIPVGMRLMGKDITAGLTLNPLVDPDFRGRGAALDLLRQLDATAADEKIAFSYAFPDDSAFPILVKQGGFKEVASLSLLIRPLKPETLAMKTTGSRVLARTATIARMVWRTPPSVKQRDVPGLAIDRVTEFDEPFAVFWRRVQRAEPLIVVRDSAYLSWRYLEAPGREYTAFAARSEGKVRGLIVLRSVALGRLSAGLVVDLIVEASGEGRAAGRLLIEHAVAHFAEQDLDLLATLSLRHTDEYRIFRASGFWLPPKFLEPHPLHFVVRSHAEVADAAYDLRNWFLTLGDSLVV